MTNSNVKNIITMLWLMAVQVLICNNIHLFGYATPLLIGYMVIAMEKGTDHINLLLWGFGTGLLYDIFSNTAGMVSAGLTLLAMMQPSLLRIMAPRDAGEGMTPNVNNMGFGSYVQYTFFSMLILHSVFFLLDAFMLSNIQLTLLAIVSSTILATILSVFIEMLSSSNKR